MPSALGSTGFALFQALSLEFWPSSSWAGGGSSPGQRNFAAAGQGGLGVSSPGTGMGLGSFTPLRFGFLRFSNSFPQILVLSVKREGRRAGESPGELN